jgi:predicted membrane chloride channel (bestrophin family)
MYLSAYIDDLVRREMINTSYIGLFMNGILEFQKALTDLEKIATTPIPSAYSFHLRLTVWAYLLFLPFQIYPLLKWVTVPAVTVAALTFLGYLEIGEQIEMPFVSCHVLRRLMMERQEADMVGV